MGEINLNDRKVHDKTIALLKGKLEEAIKLNDVIINGMYLVRVMVNDQVYCSQIVIEKQ